MTVFEVVKTGHTANDKKEEYLIKLECESGGIKFSLTMKSESKSSLEKLVPFEIGERCDISILDKNRKLSEFTTPIHTEESAEESTIIKGIEFPHVKKEDLL